MKGIFRKSTKTFLSSCLGVSCTCHQVPFKDELLSHVVWVGFESRMEKTFSSVEYIVHRYGTLFPGLDMDKLSEQFLTYQVLVEEDILHQLKNLQDLKLKIPTVSMSFGLTSKT